MGLFCVLYLSIYLVFIFSACFVQFRITDLYFWLTNNFMHWKPVLNKQTFANGMVHPAPIYSSVKHNDMILYIARQIKAKLQSGNPLQKSVVGVKASFLCSVIFGIFQHNQN